MKTVDFILNNFIIKLWIKKKLLINLQIILNIIIFCNIIESFGFVCKRQRGSHRIYSRIGISELINIQNVNGEVKPYQVKQFLYLVNKYNLEEWYEI